MQTGRSITGSVTDTATGTLEDPVCATVFDNHGSTVGSATLLTSKTYVIGELVTGTYTVSFTDCRIGFSGIVGYASQWWNGQPGAGSATPISVTAGNATNAINAAMVYSP